MGVSTNEGTPKWLVYKAPKWMVYKGKSHWNEWFGGTPILGNHYVYLRNTWNGGFHKWGYPKMAGLQSPQMDGL